MWSTQDPVTVLGAMKDVIGSEEMRGAFRWLATRFSNGTESASSWWPPAPVGTWPTPLAMSTPPSPMDGGPVAPLTLRVTHVYRREDGEWRIVHRHADPPPIDPTAPAEA
jgi:hypothetical protein